MAKKAETAAKTEKAKADIFTWKKGDKVRVVGDRAKEYADAQLEVYHVRASGEVKCQHEGASDGHTITFRPTELVIQND